MIRNELPTIRLEIPRAELVVGLTDIKKSRKVFTHENQLLGMELGVTTLSLFSRLGIDALQSSGYISPEVAESAKTVTDVVTVCAAVDAVRHFIKARTARAAVINTTNRVAQQTTIPANLL